MVAFTIVKATISATGATADMPRIWLCHTMHSVYVVPA